MTITRKTTPPLLPPSAKERRREAMHGTPLGWERRGLLVDDHLLMLEFMEKVARGFWVDVVTASSCAQARLKIATQPPFDFAILDYRLTNGVGVEIYRDLSLCSPMTQVVFLTGYNDEELRRKVEAIGPARIISKEAVMSPEFMGRLLMDMGVKARHQG